MLYEVSSSLIGQRGSDLRRRISVDSPECSSSLTSHPESSQEILTCSSQQKSRSSVQSPLLNVNKKLSVTSTTSAETNKTGDSELKPALRKTSSPKRNDNIRKQPKNESGKENIVNIQKNSLGNQNLKKRVISFEEEQPHTSNTEPSTSVPKPQTFDSYDSIDRRDQASTSRSQPEEEKTKLKKSASFESLSSVSCKSELIDTPIECYIYEKTTKPHQDKEHGVNTELQYALSQSIPVSSETLYDGTLSEDNDTYPQRQRSASVNLDKTPPSPAPATPLAHKNIYWQRRAHSCERVETQLKTDDYEFWLKHKQENETTFTAGPRHVYLKVPYGKKYSLHYETLKQNRQKENPTVELKRYREQSSSTQRAFAERIYDQFHSNRRNLTKENNRSSMGKMNSMDDHERKIIIEFCHLLEKSKQLFNGLR
ncbi:unnamed protein product [Diatraea saccharalis]|uniref:Uncharacterized protein n=1 Tax=Diatraea saccharalis TaxID=40085 RepID=A0A9N9N109_9NEOP|nr:unnamed protein product [Diatraea saccharalis]